MEASNYNERLEAGSDEGGDRKNEPILSVYKQAFFTALPFYFYPSTEKRLRTACTSNPKYMLGPESNPGPQPRS